MGPKLNNQEQSPLVAIVENNSGVDLDTMLEQVKDNVEPAQWELFMKSCQRFVGEVKGIHPMHLLVMAAGCLPLVEAAPTPTPTRDPSFRPSAAAITQYPTQKGWEPTSGTDNSLAYSIAISVAITLSICLCCACYNGKNIAKWCCGKDEADMERRLLNARVLEAENRAQAVGTLQSQREQVVIHNYVGCNPSSMYAPPQQAQPAGAETVTVTSPLATIEEGKNSEGTVLDNVVGSEESKSGRSTPN